MYLRICPQYENFNQLVFLYFFFNIFCIQSIYVKFFLSIFVLGTFIFKKI